MEEWILCDSCEEVAVTLFKIETITQHCSSVHQSQRSICDGCLQRSGIDVDLLVTVVRPEYQ